MFMKLEHIITDLNERDLGQYNVRFHGSIVTYNGVDYRYHSSGLCRTVYLSPCKRFVLKIPNSELYYPDIVDFDATDWFELHWNIRHNYLEWLAYTQCPDEFKASLAVTDMLPNGWLIQEFVTVKEVNLHHNFREIGIREDGSKCLFDLDPLISEDMKPDDVILPTISRID